MSQEGHTLDEQHKSGIWKDMHSGDFCKIQESDDGKYVELVNPENKEVYWEMSMEEWHCSEKFDFVRVQQEAVDDPVNYINRAIRIIQRNDINELSGLPMDFAIGVSWARTQVSIEEDRTF